MKQEQKELLWKDLCGRFPYKVYAQITDEYGGYTSAIESIDIDGFITDFEGAQTEIENIKPYLFPMSSMTEEQRIEYDYLHSIIFSCFEDGLSESIAKLHDWLNKNHFDYRGLIPMGLANDATGLNIY